LKLISEAKGEPIELTLLITHTHWDHIQGFPFFVPAYNPKNRLRIHGYEGARKGLESTLSSQMESPYFPISMQQMPSNIGIEEIKDLKFSIGRVNVQAQFVNHPGICVGYRLSTSCGSVAYIPDVEPFFRLKQQSLDPNDKETPALLEYARKQDQKLIDFIQDTDILIIDSQYDAQEYPSKVGWGHSCVEDAVSFALAANVRQLFLFHHDPGHDDERIAHMAAQGRATVKKLGGNLSVDAAREGLECVLKPSKRPELVVA